MVELRKRKAPAEAAALPPAKKSSNPVKQAIETAKEAVMGTSVGSEGATNGNAKIAVGQTIALEGFGGELETHTGEKVTLQKLLEQSRAGVVLFTYPKANTPGCTTQACLFRDNYTPITAAGLSVYGLSTDSAKSNTTFATKQSLPFPLLCDLSATLTGAIGMKKAAKSTTRGVVVIDKEGKVQVWEQAGPQKTVDAVMAYVQTSGSGKTSAPPPAPKSDTTMADAPPVAPPAVGSTEMAPATTTEMAAATSVEMAPATSTEMAPATSSEIAPTDAPDAHHADTTEPPKMHEAPVTKEPSAEEKKTAETAAEVNETAAKIDNVDEVKA